MPNDDGVVTDRTMAMMIVMMLTVMVLIVGALRQQFGTITPESRGLPTEGTSEF